MEERYLLAQRLRVRTSKSNIMKVTFRIEYFTTDVLHIRFKRGAALAMHSAGNGQWHISLDLTAGGTYRYEVHSISGEILRAETQEHRFEPAGTNVEIFDRWFDSAGNEPFYSTLFTESVFRREDPAPNPKCESGAILLEVEAPQVRSTELVAIVGAHPALGAWDATQARILSDAQAPLWRCSIPYNVAGSEYKFIIVDKRSRALKYFEEGENRLLPTPHEECAIVQGLRFRDSREKWRGAGVAIPVFSLRSAEGWGCGEFCDLKAMADWASTVGMSIIQVLPVNDTTSSGTWRDSYPYNAISSFALHPMYISPREVVKACSRYATPALRKQMRDVLAKYSAQGARINSLSAVDYEATTRLKERFLRKIYTLCGDQILASRSFERFFKQSREWLLPYAVFCALRDKYSSDKSKWGELEQYDEQRAEAFAQKEAKRVGYYSFVQYLLDKQLTEVRDYAHKIGITLKGDIPIGVAPTSVDVWCAPHLFNLSVSAGAPPDAFAEDGQNWGFPTYNWARMREDGYAWWCARLRKMARYFDAYRIDHILGFFRIWEVPRTERSAILGYFNPSKPYSEDEITSFGFAFNAEKQTKNRENPKDVLFIRYPYNEGYVPRIEGYKTKMYQQLDKEQQEAYMRLHEDFFYHRHNDFWRENAMRRLPALMQATRMLTCGEDLGMIPACVPDVMAQEHILSLEIERMPKQMGLAFGNTRYYPYLSVAATSTHDMSTIRGWWREDQALTQRYWSEVLHREGVAEKECSGNTAAQIIEREMLSGSMFAILPLQDWLSVDERLRLTDPDAERINIPADPNHYWRYRMHITLEQLISEDEFNEQVRSLVALR